MTRQNTQDDEGLKLMTRQNTHADQIDRSGWTCPTPSHVTGPDGVRQLCAACPESVATQSDGHLQWLALIHGNGGAKVELRARSDAGIDQARADIARAYFGAPTNPGPQIILDLARINSDLSIYARSYRATLKAHLDGRADAGRQVAEALQTHSPAVVPAALDLVLIARADELAALPPKARLDAEWLRGYIAVIHTNATRLSASTRHAAS